MASIILRKLGGMAPSANPTAIPESTATWAQNLDLRFGDFRPLPLPASLGAASAGGTLYKLEGATGFMTRPGSVNFVRGPIPNDATERTYYTGDGLPKVTDLSGAVRQLGVPAPSAAPVATVVVTAQFSEDDARAARLSKWSEIISAVRTNIDTRNQFGIPDVIAGVSDAELGSGSFAGKFMQINDTYAAGFRIPGTISAGGNFVPTNLAHSNLNDWRLGFTLGASDAYTRITVRTAGMAVGAALQGALAAITLPNSSAPLMPPEVVAAMMAAIRDGIAIADKERNDCIVRMKSNLAAYVALADGGDAGASAARGEIEGFYAQPEIVGAVSAGVTRAASATLAAMKGYTGGDGTPLPITGRPGAPDTYTQIM